MKTPSRTEIEQLVRSKPEEVLTPINPNNFNDESQQPRRQSNILGGDISGIKKKKYKTSNIGWFIAVGFILLSSLTFIIPAFTEKTPTFSNKQNKVPVNTLYQESLIEEEIKKQNSLDTNIFTLKEDTKRADSFRQIEVNDKQIDSFKMLAQKSLELGKYTQPEKDSAYYYFQQILKINGNSSYAKRGINYLSNRLYTLGVQEVEKSNLKSSRKSLAALFTINKDSEEFKKLSNLVAELEVQQEKLREQNEIKALLAKATKAIEKKRYTTPNADNAYTYYMNILAKDESNIEAAQGINDVYSYYKDKIQKSLSSEDWISAQSIIDSLMSVQFKQVFINDLSNDIINARNKKNELDKKTVELEQVLKKEQEDDLKKSLADEKKALEREQKKLEALAEAREEQAKIEQLKQEALASENQTTPLDTVQNTTRPVTVDSGRQSISNGAPVSEINNISSSKSRLEIGLDAYNEGDYINAFSNLAPLAEQNNVRAQIKIGYMYQFGRGVQKNNAVGQSYLRAALPSLRKLASQDRAWAQADLGRLYEDGIILTKSYTEALAWYRRAATKNFTAAQTNLANMYFFGRGVQKNKAEAIRWYRIAAAGGDTVAKQNLSQLGALKE